MRAIILLRLASILVATVAMVTINSTIAFADKKIGGGVDDANEEKLPVGGADGPELFAAAGGIDVDESNNGSSGSNGGSSGALTPVGDWSPPPCWYAPKYTPKQFKESWKPALTSGAPSPQWQYEQREKYENGGDEPGTYDNYNMAKTGEGYWWGGYIPEGGEGVPGALDCEDEFWVDTGDQPPAEYENAVTPEVLAEIAYGRVRVPDTDISLKPDVETGQTVNLPTWAWLDEATFQPVSVTARVPVLGMWATTTATPDSVQLEPGTEDAELHPDSGVCPIKDDGSIGTPYRPSSAEETPPCGLTYLRSTPEGETYPFQATVTWKIAWTGSGNTGDTLPEGVFGSTTDLTVQEIQTVVD